MNRPRDPLLGPLYAAALLIDTVRLRLALWRARFWAGVAEVATERARVAIADARGGGR